MNEGPEGETSGKIRQRSVVHVLVHGKMAGWAQLWWYRSSDVPVRTGRKNNDTNLSNFRNTVGTSRALIFVKWWAKTRFNFYLPLVEGTRPGACDVSRAVFQTSSRLPELCPEGRLLCGGLAVRNITLRELRNYTLSTSSRSNIPLGTENLKIFCIFFATWFWRNHKQSFDAR